MIIEIIMALCACVVIYCINGLIRNKKVFNCRERIIKGMTKKKEMINWGRYAHEGKYSYDGMMKSVFTPVKQMESELRYLIFGGKK